MRLERWAQLRGVPKEYAEALREYLDQEEEGTNPKGSQGNRPPSYVGKMPGRGVAAPGLPLVALIRKLPIETL